MPDREYESDSMDIYSGFAEVYDLFMDDVPYPAWADRVVALLKKEGIADGLVLDLGCGTGTLTRLLAERGYDMIGIDLSADMLDLARRADSSAEAMGEAVAEPSVLYLQQDMRSFELYGTVRAIVCACDSINYILKEDELRRVFQLVNNYLDPGGIFLFDCNTPYKYEQLLGENTFAENRAQGSFIWENYYDPETGINQYDLTLYVREPAGEGYRRYEETHLQRVYTVAKLKELLAASGLAFVAAFDGYEDHGPTDESERVLILAREVSKACQSGHCDP